MHRIRSNPGMKNSRFSILTHDNKSKLGCNPKALHKDYPFILVELDNDDDFGFGPEDNEEEIEEDDDITF